jgi:alginate O-acetyltransferase complex protein AlgI
VVGLAGTDVNAARATLVLFTEPIFLFVFLPVLLALYQLPGARYRNWLLLVASIVFYARGAGDFTWLVLALIAFNYIAALVVDRARGTPRARVLLGGAIAVDILVLAIFKYADFAVVNVNAALSLADIEPFALPEIVLPIGISFFTFHAISYVVDVYRRDAAAQKRPVEAALYLLVFPQLVAGPIVRYRQIAEQLTSRVRATSDFAYGIRRFVIGLGKKMLIANTLAVPADQIFAMPASEVTTLHAWTAITCYTLQIYFDFSGYSDMAIGLGRMFGFKFPENFNFPYVAASIQDFWRRWHMSLSAWFRDYVYIPLGGNRTSTGRLYFNLVLVFFLCGLWHGAAWTFVVWGLFHGAFLVLERIGLARIVAMAPRPLRHGYAMLVVMVGWVFFRADTLPQALSMLGAMAGATAPATAPYAPSWYWTTEVILAFAAGVIGATPVVPALGRRLARAGDADAPATLGLAPSIAAAAALLVLLSVSVMLSASRTYNPFIYFRF